jgi:hypothetical protein
VKRVLLAAFCILALCSLLLANAGTVKAATASGYERMDWPTVTLNTVDGQWTDIAEWNDTDYTVIDDAVAFGSTWGSGDLGVYTRWIVEFFNDTTDDAGDYFEMCLDGDNGGGTAPQTDSYRIYIEGHDTLTMYQGDGSGWTSFTPLPEDINWSATISATPNGTTPHWVLEIDILKSAGSSLLGITWGVRVAVYDESDGTLLVWPPDADRDVPDEWGTNGYSMDPWIPEGFSIVVVVLLSSAAVAVGFYFARKRPKTERAIVGKTGETTYTR